ncbi:MAG: cupin domain-containing protein [Rhodanobacteraceae bacterium]
MVSKLVSAVAMDQAPKARRSSYPEPFAALMANRIKRPLGDLFGLTNFGVNITVLAPGGISALRHAHSRQDEFIYIISGRPSLLTDAGVRELVPGSCAGFKAGTGNAHRLENRTDSTVVYLEVGDRTAGDEASYPDDDLAAKLIEGKWRFFHKSGEPYQEPVRK